MKVLISAYACEPGAGSEPGAGWAWSRAAALDHDVWVLTRANNAGPIEAALAGEPELRYTPVYLDLPRWARFWKKWPMGVQVYYLLWQFLAWRAAKRLHHEIGFDVAHHLTFAVDWMPAGVGFVEGLPFVWGPVGGATGMPWRLWRWLGWRGTINEAKRTALVTPLRRVLGDATARRAAVVVAQNSDVGQRFAHARRVVIEPNTVVETADYAIHRSDKSAVFVGRLIPLKGAAIAIEAVRRPEATDWRLDVFGAGPERARLMRQAFRGDVSSRITFHGHRPRNEVKAALASATALVFPSMHDSAPWAVAEAAAAGCRVVCLDRGGAPNIAGDEAVVVPTHSDDVAGQFAQALAAATATVPNSRWSEDRLPAVLRSLYTARATRAHE